MQKITVDLLRLAVSGAVVCAVVVAADLGGLDHHGQLANAANRVATPTRVKAISVAAPPMCWATHDRIGAAATGEAQTDPSAIAQTCASVAPASPRQGEPAREPRNVVLAFAL
jgi:hypothetical protein